MTTQLTPLAPADVVFNLLRGCDFVKQHRMQHMLRFDGFPSDGSHSQFILLRLRADDRVCRHWPHGLYQCDSSSPSFGSNRPWRIEGERQCRKGSRKYAVREAHYCTP